MNIIIPIILGLIPLTQFFVKGWLFFGVSLITFIIGYNLFKRSSSKEFLSYSISILLSQTICTLFNISNTAIFVYLLITAILFFIGSLDLKIVDNLKNFLKENKVNLKEWEFEMCYFGYGQVQAKEDIEHFESAVIGIGKEGIAFNVKMAKNNEFKKFIKYNEINDYGMYKKQKKQDYYGYAPKIRDMFLPSKDITTLHKPYLDTYILTIQTGEEIYSFYENVKIIENLVKIIEENINGGNV
ncbi:hypothetical protein OSSY52_14570 [Tepiditoga spiralis]|uniref:Uncharacterized protein n=1 Tax=Tepiditoga spiralis TaxID=2108365 RepID=A0A7G1G7I8_9BACT|nr:hypothetical protein [Tepiditoga spiralis]BBE31316.1 hypothetical protein OSSY52_14570 [Tepiditoga spiralis]